MIAARSTSTRVRRIIVDDGMYADHAPDPPACQAGHRREISAKPGPAPEAVSRPEVIAFRVAPQLRSVGEAPDAPAAFAGYAAFFFSARSISAGVTTSDRPRGMISPSRASWLNAREIVSRARPD